MKKLFIVAVLMLSLVVTGIAQAQEKWDGSITVAGHQVKNCFIKIVWNKDSGKPVYMLPIRGTAEALGYAVEWDKVNQVVTVISPGETVTSKTIGSVILERKVRPSVTWAVYQDHIEIATEGVKYIYNFKPDEMHPERHSGTTYLSIDTIKQIFGLKEMFK